MRPARLAAAALLAALVLAGCGTSSTTIIRTVTPTPTASVPADHGNREATRALPGGLSCGVERWAVKTGTDTMAAQVNLTNIMPATVASLTALIPPPGPLPQDSRIAPAELTVFRVQATLTGFRQEGDSDWHLILAQTLPDGTVATMIAEIPAPGCVGAGSPFAAAIAAARQAFAARFTPDPGGAPTTVSVPVTVTGVGFFDTLHGQTGVAPNGIELHPVLSVTFGP